MPSLNSLRIKPVLSGTDRDKKRSNTLVSGDGSSGFGPVCRSRTKTGLFRTDLSPVVDLN